MNTMTLIKPELLSFTADQFQALLPLVAVFGGCVLTVIFSVLPGSKWIVFLMTLATAMGGALLSFGQFHESNTTTYFNQMLVMDSFSGLFGMLFLVSAGVTAMVSLRYLDWQRLQHPEYYVLLLFSALGMMLMVSSIDLIMIFISLELMSLAVYVLVGFRRADRRCNEAAMKYFILGSAASAVLLYGAALLYGTTGSTGIRAVLEYLHSSKPLTPVFVLGLWMVTVGFLFKVAAVPFHMWMPDVYEGAPAPVTGFMTTGLKAAAFATFVRVFVSMGYGSSLSAATQAHVHDILWACAVLTMAVGNLVALTQTNLKRMLAYSSIAHTGYLIVGILAAPASEQGYAPVAMYLIAYAAMNLGAFVVLTRLASQEDGGLNLHDLSGLSQRRPWLAFSMAVFMLSMAGVPPTAGFAAKYVLFYSAVQAHEITLVVISVLCSAISVYYYLRVLVFMYMRDPTGSPAASRGSVWSTVAVTAMVAVTLQVGMLPARTVSIVKKAVTSL